jgi:TP901 family phage tail tape measure protein
MSLKIDRLQLEIIINNDQARKSLRLLEEEARQLKKELKKVPEGSAEWNRINDRIKAIQVQHDKLIESLGIEKLTIKELGQRQKELNAIMRNLDPSTQAYKDLDKQLTLIKNRQAQLKGATNDAGMSLSKMADGFNKYFAIITAGAATLTGFIMGMRKAVDVFNLFEKRVDNLSALTGLVGDDLAWLSDEAKKMSVATIEGNIRIASSATEIVDAYTKVGSKRPELLKVKEDLASVTQEAMILAAAADGVLQPAVDGLSMVLNQFNKPASESRKIINVLAAGSLEGAGEIDYLAAGFEKAGSVANSFGISIEELTGHFETLAPRITEPEMAGRSLRNIMIKLETQSNDKLKPSIVGLAGAFEYMKEKQWSVTQMTDLFGTENINAANILVNNTAETKKYTLAVTDTDVALRQAATNTDNNATKLQQARNQVELLTIAFGEKLAPAMTFSTNSFAYLMKAVMEAPAFFVKYQMALIALTGAYLAYHGVVVQATLIKIANNLLLKEGIGLKIKDAIVLQALIAKEQLATIWKANSTVATKLATTAQWAWNAAVAAFPMGAIIVGITALVVAIKTYDKYNAESVRLEKEKAEAINKLTSVNQNLYTSFMNQEVAIGQLNKMSIEQKKNLYEQTKATLTQAEAELVLMQATQKRIEQDNTRATMWQKFANTVLSINNPAVASVWNVVDAAKNGKEASDQMNESITAIQSNIKQLYTQSSGLDNILNSEKIADAITGKTINDLEDKQRALTTALKNTVKGSEDYIRINKKLSAVNLALNSDGGGGNDEDKLKKRLAAVEKANNMELKAIKQRHLEGKTTEEQYHVELLAQDMKFLSDKAALYKIGSNEYEAIQVEILNKQLAAEKEMNDLILRANKELADAKIQNIQDGIEKERLLEEQRWANEKASLEKQLIEKQILSDKEVAYNDTINKTIQERYASHLLTIKQITDAAAIQKQMDKALLAEANAQTDVARWAAERQIAQVQYQDELNLANGNAVQIAQAERKLSDTLIKIKTEELNKRQQIGDAIFGAAGELFGALVVLAGKESALGKAMFLLQQATAIGQVIFSTAIANAKAVATFPLTLGMPWVALNTASAAVSIAAIVAQSIASFKTPKYAEGNAQDILAQDGRTYRATVTNSKHKSGLFSKPTFVPGFGLFGETPQPELVFNPKDTTAIMNTPGLINAINHTLGGSRQFAQGNYREVIKETNTNTTQQSDPRITVLLDKLEQRLAQPTQAFLVSNEEYLRKQKEAMTKYETFISKK